MSVEVADARESGRYEVEADGELAGFAQYGLDGGRITFTHTEVDPAMRGRGLAEQLIRFALDDAKRRELQVAPACSYVRKVIADNPQDYLALVPTGDRADFGLPADD